MKLTAQEQEIVEDFSMFDDWTDKYQYIIELGEKLAPFPKDAYKDENKVKGCQSSVWLISSFEKGKVILRADSDSAIVKGLVDMLLTVLSDKTPEEIIAHELGFIEALGLKQHLAQTRANGLSAMIKQIKLFALAYQSQEQHG